MFLYGVVPGLWGMVERTGNEAVRPRGGRAEVPVEGVTEALLVGYGFVLPDKPTNLIVCHFLSCVLVVKRIFL